MFSLNHVLSCATMSSFAAEKLALERHLCGAVPQGEACAPAGALPSAQKPTRISTACEPLQKRTGSISHQYTPLLISAHLEACHAIPEGLSPGA